MQPRNDPLSAFSLSVLSALFERAGDPVAVVNEDGTIACVNEAERKLFESIPSASRRLAVGALYMDCLADLFSEANPEVAAVGEGLRAVLRQERASFEIECRCGREKEMRWRSFRILACQLEDRPGAILFKHDITIRRQRELDLEQREERLSLLLSLSTDALALSENGIILDCNEGMCKLTGYRREELIGQSAEVLVPPESREQVREHVLKNLDTPYETLAVRKDGTVFEVSSTGHRMLYGGRSIRGTSFRDLTLLKEAQRALNQAQEEKLHAQASLLAELSTPLIPLNQQVLVMPLIGSIDSQRAQQVLETLLRGIEAHRARTVIIDITGVRTVDSHVANTLVQAAKAARLLGTEVVLTGIRAEVAQTLVRLGAGLEDLITESTLQSGIAHAIHRVA